MECSRISSDRLEIDVIDLRGTAFAGTDSRLWCLEALRQGICRGIVLDRNGQPEQPSTVLRKPALVVGTEASASATGDPLRVISGAFEQLKREGGGSEREPITVLDLRLGELSNPSAGDRSVLMDHLGRASARTTVVITDQTMLHPVVEYLRRYSSAPFRLVTSVSVFARLISASYAALPGSLLEGLAKLLQRTSKAVSLPVRCRCSSGSKAGSPRRVTASSAREVVSVDDLRCEAPLDDLLRYLRGAGWIVPLELPPVE